MPVLKHAPATHRRTARRAVVLDTSRIVDLIGELTPERRAFMETVIRGLADNSITVDRLRAAMPMINAAQDLDARRRGRALRDIARDLSAPAEAA